MGGTKNHNNHKDGGIYYDEEKKNRSGDRADSSMYHCAVCGGSLQQNIKRRKSCAPGGHNISYGGHDHYCSADNDSAGDYNCSDNYYCAPDHDHSDLCDDRNYYRTDNNSGHDCSGNDYTGAAHSF